MYCAVSGNAPEHPVVSTKSGHLFEQSVIEKYIASTGKCPVTGEALGADDLLPLKVSSTVKPRPVAATSIPGMLTLFQNEWDALMLETFSLKQQLETVRQELGHALYQHDAACRVIARLMKERDDARAALAEARPAAPGAAAAAGAAPPPAAAAAEAAAGLPAEIGAAFDAKAKQLSKPRKKRQPPEGQADADAIAALSVVATHNAHGAGATCVAMHPSEGLAATGGADGKVVLYDAAASKARATLSGHAGGVTCVALHPSRAAVLSGGADGVAQLWSTAAGGKRSRIHI